jgi:hypothetical protein
MVRPTPKKLELLKKLLEEKGIRAAETPAGILARGTDGDRPLSLGQERLWFLDQLEPGTSLYNDALVLTIRGVELDPALVRAAMQEIVRRHSVLRATYHRGADGPVQRTHESARLGHELPFEVHDFTGETDARERAAGLFLADAQAPYALDRLPLVRARLARIAPGEWQLGLAMHHIVSDGVSYGVVYRELGALYRALAAGEPSPLPEPRIQFSDYAAWERERLSEERTEEGLAHWKRVLGGTLPRLAWPARAATPSHRGAYHRFRFPDALYAALTDFCRREHVTSNWVLLASYLAFLHVLTGQEDLRIGNPSSTRKHKDLEDLIGFFVQTVILRVDLSGNPTFLELLERTRRTALEGAKHEGVPYDRIVRALRSAGSREDVPLIPAWIAPMKDLMPVLELPGATSSYEIVDGRSARFELALILDEARGGVSAFFEYDTDLFDPEGVERFAERYMRILRQVVDHPETTLQLLRETTSAAPASPGTGPRARGLDAARRRIVEGRSTP